MELVVRDCINLGTETRHVPSATQDIVPLGFFATNVVTYPGTMPKI